MSPSCNSLLNPFFSGLRFRVLFSHLICFACWEIRGKIVGFGLFELSLCVGLLDLGIKVQIFLVEA